MLSNEQIAEVCHEALRVLQHIQGDPDPSPAWADMPETERMPAVEGVHGARLGHTPAQSHASWCQVKYRDGWRYGPVKDPVAKTHPCLVPYAELPEGQRAKDRVFVAIVRALAGVRDA